MVVERDARRHDVDERDPLVLDCGLDQRNELSLVAGKPARDERRAENERELHQIDRLVAVHRAALCLRALVGGGRELPLGEPVHAVVLDDVHHVDAAPHDVRELAEPDRRGVAVTGHAEIDQVAVGERRARHDRRHSPVHAVEAVAGREKVGRRLRRAADARELRDAMRRYRQLVERLDDRRGNRVVAAARA
jgi:hypothetical protein